MDKQGNANYKCTRVGCPGGEISNDFVCTCNPGNVGGGSFAESNRTYPTCITVPCLNGGIKTVLGKQECACNVGFEGGGKPQQDNSYTPCTTVACAHGTISNDRASCACDIGYQGGGQFLDDADEYPVCKPAVCPNGQVAKQRDTCACNAVRRLGPKTCRLFHTHFFGVSFTSQVCSSYTNVVKYWDTGCCSN